MPAGSARIRLLAAGRRRRLDCARFRNRDFENSLTAYAMCRQLQSLCEPPRLPASLYQALRLSPMASGV